VEEKSISTVLVGHSSPRGQPLLSKIPEKDDEEILDKQRCKNEDARERTCVKLE
jgi:hypothetical protein